jgi:hypothetical protein
VHALGALASAEVRTGLAEAGLAHFDEARSLAAAVGDQRSIIGCGAGAADARTRLGDDAGAVQAYRELIPAARELGDEYVLTVILRNLGGRLVAIGDPGAGDVLTEARDRCRSAGREGDAADCALVLAQHELAHGEPGRAFAVTTEGLGAHAAVDPSTVAGGIGTRGRALLQAGWPIQAAPLICAAAALLADDDMGTGEALDAALDEVRASVPANVLAEASRAAEGAELADVVQAALAVAWPSG